jgi:hypothetical protein
MKKRGYKHDMTASLFSEQQLKQAVEEAGEAPVRVEDPETRTAYVLIREDIYRRLHALSAIDHIDPSFFEFGEFHPDE